jgi:methylglutaconyl-CoA hydratase
MKFQTLETEITGHILNCRLHRPEKRNAINRAMLRDLLTLFNSIPADSEIRIAVIRGAGKVFSAGADLAMMSDVSGKDPQALKNDAALFYDCFDALYRLPVPAICYAHGGVHGGANGLVAASDYAFCSPETRFSFGEVRLGLIPATVAPFIVRRTGIINAKKIMLSGTVFDASEARFMGLVDYVVSETEAESRIGELAGAVLSGGPQAVSATKKYLLDLGEPAAANDIREISTELITRARLSGEAAEGIEAFFNKKDPGWAPGSG